MKSDTLKFLLDCYLREDCLYDTVDGIEYSPTNPDYGFLAGERPEAVRERVSDFGFYEPECAAQGRGQNEIVFDPVQEQQIRHFARLLRSYSNEFERSLQNRTAVTESAVMNFKDSILFASVSSKIVHVPVVRNGDTNKVVRLKWKTSNETAISGINYSGGSGEIVFAEGEVEKMIVIPILTHFEDNKDYRFRVSLESSDQDVIGPQNKITICIVDRDNFYEEENKVVENMLKLKRCDVSSIASCLHDKVTPRTFHTALQYICSDARSVPEELALACQLTKFTLRKLRRMCIYEIVCDYFRTLPELEDIGHHFDGFH